MTHKHKTALLNRLDRMKSIDSPVDKAVLDEVGISVPSGCNTIPEDVRQQVWDISKKLESELSKEEEVANQIHNRYKDKSSILDISSPDAFTEMVSTDGCIVNVEDKQYLIFPFDRKEVIANFNSAKVTQITQAGYGNDLDTTLKNVREVMEALYKAGFLTRGIKLVFGGLSASTLDISVCV